MRIHSVVWDPHPSSKRNSLSKLNPESKEKVVEIEKKKKNIEVFQLGNIVNRKKNNSQKIDFKKRLHSGGGVLRIIIILP